MCTRMLPVQVLAAIADALELTHDQQMLLSQAAGYPGELREFIDNKKANQKKLKLSD